MTSDLCIWGGFLEEAGFELFEKNLIGSYWRKDTFFFFFFETKFLGSPHSWDCQGQRACSVWSPVSGCGEFGGF